MNERRIERTKRFLDSVQQELVKQDARASAAGLQAAAAAAAASAPAQLSARPRGLRA